MKTVRIPEVSEELFQVIKDIEERIADLNQLIHENKKEEYQRLMGGELVNLILSSYSTCNRQRRRIVDIFKSVLNAKNGLKEGQYLAVLKDQKIVEGCVIKKDDGFYLRGHNGGYWKINSNY